MPLPRFRVHLQVRQEDRRDGGGGAPHQHLDPQEVREKFLDDQLDETSEFWQVVAVLCDKTTAIVHGISMFGMSDKVMRQIRKAGREQLKRYRAADEVIAEIGRFSRTTPIKKNLAS